MGTTIRVSAVALFDGARLLTVRKRGTELFQYPGGKPEVGESPREAAVRETLEETGVELSQDHLEFVGTFSAPAANEDNSTVVADLFRTVLPSSVDAKAISPASEIEECRWVRTDQLDNQAPLMAVTFPFLSH